MANLSAFLKKNKKIRPNFFYPATKSLCDEDGTPVEWEFKPISTKESEDLRIACTVTKIGKGGQPQATLDTKKYINALIVKATVSPDLNNKELQDSYGVLTPEDLVFELIDCPSEYNELVKVIQDASDLNDTIGDKVKQAKN